MNKIVLITNYLLFSCFAGWTKSGGESDTKSRYPIDHCINVFSDTKTKPASSG